MRRETLTNFIEPAFGNISVSSLDYSVITVDTATVLKGTAAEARPKIMEKGQRAGFRSGLLLFYKYLQKRAFKVGNGGIPNSVKKFVFVTSW